MPRLPESKQKSVIERLWKKTVIDGECRIWTGKTVGNPTKYGEIWYDGRGIRIGRLICHLFHCADLKDDSWTANHRVVCKSSLCWNPEHLYVGTPADNVKDQIAQGTFVDGRRNLLGWQKRRHISKE